MKEKTAESRVQSIARYIKKKLKDAGVYDSTLAYQLVYRKFRDACLSDDTAVSFTEKSREGDDRIKVSPLFSAMRQQSKIVREGLDALTMNIKSKKVKKEVDDKLYEILNQFKQFDD